MAGSEWRLSTLLRRSGWRWRMTGVGHFDPFPPPRLNGWCVAPRHLMSVRLPTQLSRPRRVLQTPGMGHEDRFPPPRLSGRCGFSQGTYAGTRGNGRDAPIPAVRRTRTLRVSDAPGSQPAGLMGFSIAGRLPAQSTHQVLLGLISSLTPIGAAVARSKCASSQTWRASSPTRRGLHLPLPKK